MFMLTYCDGKPGVKRRPTQVRLPTPVIKASLFSNKTSAPLTINRTQICIDLKLCVRAFPSFIISSPPSLGYKICFLSVKGLEMNRELVNSKQTFLRL